MREEPGDLEEQVRDHLLRNVQLVLHEIRQPLAAIFALAEAARSRPGVPVEVRTYLAQIVEQAGEISGAAWSVLAPGNAGTDSDAEPVDVDEVVASVLDGFRLTWPGTFVRHGDRARSPVAGDRASVRRCLVNVVENAVRAAGSSGKVTLTVRRGAEAVTILVEDDGPGFGHGPRGTGLGIEVTRQSLAAIGGHLAAGVPSRTGGGAVALSLPLAAAPGYAGRPVRAM